MKNIFYIVLTALALTGCYEQERKCADFKTGKFTFETEINGVKKITTFERTETLEIETFEGRTDTSSVRWISDCECIMEKINPKNAQEKKAVDMKILTTKGNSYTFEFSLVGDSQKQKGTVTKIN